MARYLFGSFVSLSHQSHLWGVSRRLLWTVFRDVLADNDLLLRFQVFLGRVNCLGIVSGHVLQLSSQIYALVIKYQMGFSSLFLGLLLFKQTVDGPLLLFLPLTKPPFCPGISLT